MTDPRTIYWPKESTLSRSVRAQKVATFLSALAPDRAWEIIVQPFKRKRTDRQNAYLWAVPNKMISDETGYEAEEIHKLLLGKHFGWKDKKVPRTPRNPDGIESVPIRTTTTDENGKRAVLNTQQFSDYVAFVQRFAAQELGLMIPDPDPLYGLFPEEEQKAA